MPHGRSFAQEHPAEYARMMYEPMQPRLVVSTPPERTGRRYMAGLDGSLTPMPTPAQRTTSTPRCHHRSQLVAVRPPERKSPTTMVGSFPRIRSVRVRKAA